MERPTRRRFLTTLAAGSLTLVSRPARAALASRSRELRFNHLHTGETLAVEYFQSGRYQPDALDAVNHLLRDFRTGDEHAIDPALLDVLFEVRQRVGTRRSFEVISGYRSPVTNAALRRKSEGVAARSLHMSGKAIDIRLNDVRLDALRRSALTLSAGGVGYYPASNFVHLDTGRVRTW